MATLDNTLDAHDREIQALIDEFERQLSQIVSQAQARTVADVTRRLSFVDGVVAQTPANRRVLRTLGDTFLEHMNELGYPDLVDGFVSQFGNQFGYFRQVLQTTLEEADAEKLFEVAFTDQDHKFFTMQVQDAATAIEQTVTNVAAVMRDKTLLSIGGLRASSLADMVSTELNRSIGQAKSVAATSISTFYRTVADVGYKHVEEDPNWEIRYKYVGPPSSDPIIRPFCRHLMAEVQAGTDWTREQIERMDNGQLPNPFLTGGGWNCRHQWVISRVIELTRTKGK